MIPRYGSFFLAITAALVAPGCSKQSDATRAAAQCTPSALAETGSTGIAALAESDPALQSLSRLNAEARAYAAEAHATGRPEKARRLAQTLRERASILRAVALRDPEAASRFGLRAPELPRDLPNDGEGLECLEREVSVRGTVKAYFAESADASGKPVYFLESDEGERFLLVFSRRVPDLRSGSRLTTQGTRYPCGSGVAEVAGISYGDPLVVPAPTPSSTPTTTVEDVEPALTTVGPQNIATIVVRFQDSTATYSVAQAHDVVFNQVDEFIREGSFGQSWTTGQAYGPFTIAISRSSCDPSGIASAARSALSASGVALSQFDRFIYVFPVNDCGWLGLGTVGGYPYSEAWINGSLVLHTVAHELGHNLGLFHGKALDCGTETLSSTGTCGSLEYGDTTNTMGNRLAGHYTAFQKESLGWMEPGGRSLVGSIAAAGVYYLEPYETTPAAGQKSWKVLRSVNSTTGERKYFYLEYRQPVGYDAVLATPSGGNLTAGLIVHAGSSASADSSYLLHMHPGSSWYQAALGVGETYTDATSGVSVTVLSAGVEGATVAVTPNGSVTAPPTPCSAADNAN